MDLKPKTLYSSGYDLLFDIIAIPSEAFFVSINEFADACGIPHQVLRFDGLPLQGLSVIPIHPAMNLCTYHFMKFSI